MKIAYFDCFAGAGGDMIIASMLDAGLDGGELISKIESLGLEAQIKISKVIRCGIAASYFEVIEHHHHHHGEVEHHHHHHRTLPDIKQIIRTSEFSDKVKQNAIRVFEKLGQAEAKVHGKHIDEVHFHEVGAVDSIIDIVAACAGFEMLGCEQIHASVLAVGSGTVKTSHGLLPVPCPATAEIVKGVPITPGPLEMELLTPTAAAILTTFAQSFGPMPAMNIETIGLGAGSKDSHKVPNVLRLCIGEVSASADTETDSIALLETNCDDITGEVAGVIVDMAMQAGALDAFSSPIYMKNSRPAFTISIICRVEDTLRFEKLLFTQGVTLGIRKQNLVRAKLKRTVVDINTPLGGVRVKQGFYENKIVFAKPELADCVKIATEKGVAVKEVIEIIMSAYKTSPGR